MSAGFSNPDSNHQHTALLATAATPTSAVVPAVSLSGWDSCIQFASRCWAVSTNRYGTSYMQSCWQPLHPQFQPTTEQPPRYIGYLDWNRSLICAIARPAGLLALTAFCMRANRSESLSLAATSAASLGHDMASKASAFALLSGIRDINLQEIDTAACGAA